MNEFKEMLKETGCEIDQQIRQLEFLDQIRRIDPILKERALGNLKLSRAVVNLHQRDVELREMSLKLEAMKGR